MKTTAVVAALLASVAMAQPHHGRHAHQKKDLDKRKYETEWVTETQWATVLIDENGSTTLQGPSPAQFYPSTTSKETTSTTSTSTSESTSEPPSSTTPEPTSVEPEPTIYSTPEAATVESKPTTTNQAPVYTPTTAETAQPTSGSDSGSSGGGSYAGELTFYDVTGTGACGNELTGMTPSGAGAGDPAVVALAASRFSNLENSNLDPICGKILKFTYGGKTGYGRVMDKCQACAYDDVDVNPEAFANVAGLDKGRISITWDWA